MSGRFPLYTDADVQGQCIKALQRAGWDVLRAVDAFPEKAPDLTHFERAVALGRVLVSNDDDQRQIARQWHKNKKPFPGVIWWPQPQYQLMRPSDVVTRFEEYAAQDDPFAHYPILNLKPPKR